VLNSCRPLVVGEDPFNLERLRWKIAVPFYVRMFGSNLVNAYAAIEFACLDIQGKAIGRPVCDLLGGRLADRISITAYVFYQAEGGDTSWEGTSERLVEYVASLVGNYGLRSIKIKGGVHPPDQEVETFITLRRRFPGLPMRIDPNSVWSVATSARIARRLAEYDIEYLEDPTWGLAGMARVKRMVPYVPLASNMACFGYEDIAPAALLEAVDVVLADPHWYGGLRATKSLAMVLETLNLDMGMHSGTEFGVSLAALLHLAAAIPNLSHAPDAHYHYLEDDIIQGGKLKYEDGGIALPAGPGLGVELDEEKVERYHGLYEQFIASPLATQPRMGPVITKPKW
ncbi:MAG: enolase C-terminal domain-like protein, partial [Chloroflexota bacterium]|nr:enolase C-terminal domain-like protein [Chloroflexota bacterium]